MSKFNTFDNHPLIPNSNQYFYEKKFVSINSEDRDIIKFPNSSEFEIELPQDYLNVATARLYSWSFPSNYSTFSFINSNIAMTFKFSNLYNPGENGYSDVLTEGIFAALYYNLDKEYIIFIEPGFYNPDQMAIELTNKFNEAVTNLISSYLKDNPQYSQAYSLFKYYDRFTIVYNSVGARLWFGNNADQFIITNESNLYFLNTYLKNSCIRKNFLPDFVNWGLPSYLGFSRCNQEANTTLDAYNLLVSELDPLISNNLIYSALPRFYYGDAKNNGDNGYWLIPVLPGAQAYFIQTPYKINFMGPNYLYLEIDGLNCIDETSPYNLSKFTVQTNETNGIVNSSFAKIAITTTPLSQYYDDSFVPYKYFNPPAERIRKLKIKVRFHNGQAVDFGTFDYSFMIEFNILRPQNERTFSARDAYSLIQSQRNSS